MEVSNLNKWRYFFFNEHAGIRQQIFRSVIKDHDCMLKKVTLGRGIEKKGWLKVEKSITVQ